MLCKLMRPFKSCLAKQTAQCQSGMSISNCGGRYFTANETATLFQPILFGKAGFPSWFTKPLSNNLSWRENKFCSDNKWGRYFSYLNVFHNVTYCSFKALTEPYCVHAVSEYCNDSPEFINLLHSFLTHRPRIYITLEVCAE